MSKGIEGQLSFSSLTLEHHTFRRSYFDDELGSRWLKKERQELVKQQGVISYLFSRRS